MRIQLDIGDNQKIIIEPLGPMYAKAGVKITVEDYFPHSIQEDAQIVLELDAATVGALVRSLDLLS